MGGPLACGPPPSQNGQLPQEEADVLQEVQEAHATLRVAVQAGQGIVVCSGYGDVCRLSLGVCFRAVGGECCSRARRWFVFGFGCVNATCPELPELSNFPVVMARSRSMRLKTW